MDESNIPIDINTTKLLDWLISRRHVNKDWQNNIIKVREKINNAIQDMPVHEGIVKLLSGQHINYFHCLKIIEILKETEKDTKNLFGRYGSQRMKDWNDIIAFYQKDNLYLAEAAQMVIRNVNFEVPSLKKQMQKFEQTQLECEKKIKDYTKAETTAQNEFTASCKQLGIEGVKIKKELIQLLQELPVIYKKSADKIKIIQSGLEMYKAFIEFQLGKKQDFEILPTLQYLVQNGNTTTYEYTYGEKPISVEVPPLNIIDDEDKKTNDGIDFGDNGPEIDFGDSIDFNTDSINVNTDSINLNLESINLNTDSIDFCVSEGEIDFGTPSTEEGFEIIDHVDVDINLEESGIVVETSGNDGGIARGSDAYTIMDNPKTRDMLINDLMELESFLKLRMYEMSLDSDVLSMSQIDVPTIIQMQTLESITCMADCVQVALNELINKRTQHLHNVKHSSKYVDILTASLKQKLSVVERMQASKKILEEKIKVVRDEWRQLGPIIENIIENTRVLQKDIEDDLSKKYKGRKVHLTGGVNVM